MKTKSSSQTLTQLWQRRKNLDQAEWGQLYQLVSRVLKQSCCSELGSLPLDITHYIDDFFRDKVFLPTIKKTFKENQLFSNHALIVFFCRYLRRILDDPYIRKGFTP